MLTPRELVLEALAKRQTETIPYQLDLTDAVHERLAAYFGNPDFENGIGNALALERNELLEAIGSNQVRDMFGVIWSREQKGDFGIVEKILLEEAEFADYIFPEPDEAAIVAKCERLVLRKENQFTMYIIGFSLFERAWSLRGMENFLMDFLLNPEFADELLRRIVDYNLKVIDIVARYPIDCVFFGDDWGQQRGLIMGPSHWRRFIKPELARMYGAVKARGMKVAQHSCGDISELFPDLIELGLDIYNTFQPEIYDVEEMKRLYGAELTFYGGISTQRLLPFAMPEEIKAETRRLMKVIGSGGGYIVAPTHSIPDDVPTENILAFLDAVQNQKPIGDGR